MPLLRLRMWWWSIKCPAADWATERWGVCTCRSLQSVSLSLANRFGRSTWGPQHLANNFPLSSYIFPLIFDPVFPFGKVHCECMKGSELKGPPPPPPSTKVGSGTSGCLYSLWGQLILPTLCPACKLVGKACVYHTLEHFWGLEIDQKGG